MRSLAREGERVAPFKAQNTSNKARVVAGGEIGVKVAPVLEQTFERLADTVDRHLDTTWLRLLLHPEPQR